MDDSQAAVKLQRSCRGFRHRRMLADAIIMKHWRRVVLFASQNSSTTFLNGSSNTRWTRIGFNASLIDPRHRYGHSLRLSFTHWFTSNAGQPFFYWLDQGAGKKINITECPRSKLREQCVKYLRPKEKGRFHHSSILAGGATTVAGSLVAEHGVLKSISANSGHYQPGEDTLDRFLSFLVENEGNLHGVQIEGVEPVIT